MPESSHLILPYGDRLVNLIVDDEAQADVRALASRLPSLQISERSVCDLELLAVGGFSPLTSFMGRADYDRVLGEMRLASGLVFPIPVTLPADPADSIGLGREVALRDSKNDLLAVLHIEEIYPWDLEDMSRQVFGTTDPKHPLVAEMYRWGKLNLAGSLRVLRLPTHYDFRELRMTPLETRRR